MQRIVVIGCSGSGKSTLARELGRRLSLPVIHLDALFWQPGWKQPSDRAAFDRQVLEVAARESWIIDGGYSSTIAERLRRADTVVLFDLPTWLCLWRITRRAITLLGRTRPDMAPGCVEKLPDLEFLNFTLTYRKLRIPRREAEIARHFKGRLVRLRRVRDVDAFLDSLPAPQG